MRLNVFTVSVLREGTQLQFVAGGLLAPGASQLRIEALFRLLFRPGEPQKGRKKVANQMRRDGGCGCGHRKQLITSQFEISLARLAREEQR